MTKYWSKDARVYAGGYDMTGASTGLDMEEKVDSLDATVFGSTGARRLAGAKDDRVAHNVLFDNTPTSYYTDSGDVVVDNPLLKGSTTINVVAGGNFAIGQYIRIDSEVILITNIVVNALTVTRAHFGTADVQHAAATTIYIYGAPADRSPEAALKALHAADTIVTFLPAGDVQSQPAYFGEVIMPGYRTVSRLRELTAQSAEYEQDSDEGFERGKVLTIKGENTAAAGVWDGASIDEVAASADGGSAVIQIFDIDATSVTGFVQESSDNGVGDPWSDSIAFTIVNDDSEPASERKEVAGAVERYVRAHAHIPGGNDKATIAMQWKRY